MTRSRYLALIAEQALARGVPLHVELDAARPYTSYPSVVAASAHAREGHLSLALSFLPVDRLISASALLEPRAMAAAGRRVRALPTRFSTALMLVLPCLYLSALLAAELLTAWMLETRALGTLAAISNEPLISLAPAKAAAMGSLVLVWGVPAFYLIRRGGSGPRAHVLELIRGARLFAVASELARFGIAPGTSLRTLAGSAGLGEDAFAALGGGGPGRSPVQPEGRDQAPLDAAACDTGSAWLASEAERRVQRIESALIVAGTLAAVAIAFLLLSSVYVTISRFAEVSS